MSQFPSWMTRRFMRSPMAAMVQMAVVVPTMGKIPMVSPLAMLRARRAGVIPCLRSAVSGAMMYFLK
ncbi:MAG TPA: hypothetical protein P5285_11810 [Desulfomonilia bacterium]|nr:hypothetical protein [Desulfomonilia bacterium]